MGASENVADVIQGCRNEGRRLHAHKKRKEAKVKPGGIQSQKGQTGSHIKAF